MHKTRAEAKELASSIVRGLGETSNRVMVAPPFTALADVKSVLTGTPVLLGAQNMSSEESGAHTGEVSVTMLEDCGVDVVIIGHSERRIIYGETDELVNRKVRLALKHGMEVILCVGETIEQRDTGNAERVVIGQVTAGFEGIESESLGKITLAYEPVWAIGTGKTATPQDADAIHAVIRKTLSSLYSPAAADGMIIQYGGSVKPGNVKELMAMENIDGALVGGASLETDSFLSIALFDKE